MSALIEAVNKSGCLLDSQLDQFLACYLKPVSKTPDEDQFKAIIEDVQSFDWALAASLELDQLGPDLIAGGLYLASSSRVVEAKVDQATVDLYDIVILKRTVPKTFAAILTLVNEHVSN